MRRVLALTVAGVGLTIGQAYAACSNPAGSAGATTYATNANIMVYCDGTNWVSMAGGVSVTIGGTTYNNTPGGSANQVQYNNGSGGFAGDSGLTYSGGLLTATNISTTNLTASGNVTAAAFYGDGSNLTGIGISSVPWVSLTNVPTVLQNISNSTGSVTATSFNASLVSATNGYFGNVSTTSLWVNGQQITGNASGDRIVSGTGNSVGMIANSNTNIISITTAGVTGGYFNSNGVLTAPGISATSNLTSVTTLYASGNVYSGTTGGDWGTTWQMEARKDQNATTYLGVNNATSGASAGTQLRMIGGTANSFTYYSLMDNSANPYTQFAAGSGVQYAYWNFPNYYFQNPTATSTWMMINSSGNVGISTTSPNAKLDVAGNVSVTGGVSITGNLGIGGSNIGGAKLTVHSGTDTNVMIYNNGGNQSMISSVNDANNTNEPMAFNGSSFFFQNGKVGIGRSTAVAPLDVVGTISASSAIQVGTASSLTCSTSISGTMRYSAVSSTMEYCNGSSWSSLGPSGTTVGFRAFRNATQTVTTATPVKVVWNTTTWDSNSAFNTSTGTYTVQVAGVYILSTNVLMQTAGTNAEMYIYVNGSPTSCEGSHSLSSGSFGNYNMNASCVIPLSAGDAVTVYVYSNTASNAATIYSSHNQFSGALITSTGGSSGSGSSSAGATGDVQYNNGGLLSADTGNFTYSGGILKVGGISTTTNQASVTTLYASGNVGIGTTAPGSKLEVNDQTQATVASIYTSDTMQAGLNIGVSATNRWSLYRDSNSSSLSRGFGIYEATSGAGGSFGTRFMIAQGGNVGISTSVAPTARLEVVGNISASNVYVTATTGTVSATYGYFKYISATSGLGAATPGGVSGSLQFNSGGSLAGNTNYFISGTTASPEVWISGTTYPYLYLNNSGSTNSTTLIRFASRGNTTMGLGTDVNQTGAQNFWLYDYVAGANRLLIDGSGNVGIGTGMGTINAKLEVSSTSAPQIRIGTTGGDTGGYMASTVSDNLALSGGAAWNGTNWVAKATNAEIISMYSGQITFWSNTGLTAGSSYTPTSRMFIDSTGNVGIGTTSPATKLALQPAAYSTALDGIKFQSGDNSVHDVIQPIKVAAGAMNLMLAANSYVNTGGSVSRFDTSTPSANINVRSNDGQIQFATGSASVTPTVKMLIDSTGNVSLTGPLQVGSSLLTCSTSISGTMRYSAISTTMEYCNGSAWMSMGPSATQPIAFSVNKGGTNQTVTANTWTKVTWSSVAFDTNNNFASDRFTATVPGKYQVNAAITCTSAAYCYISVRKNGSDVFYLLFTNAGGGSYHQSSLASGIVDMSAGDYLELYVFDAGTTLSGTASNTYFQGVLLAPQGGSGGTATPAGSTNDVQFNSSGALGADTGNFTYSSSVLKAPTVSATTISGTYHYGTYVSATNASVGTLTASAISVTTNQTSVTTLYASGKVGIGTAAPSTTLEVANGVAAPASAASSWDTTGGQLNLTSTAANATDGGSALVFRSLLAAGTPGGFAAIKGGIESTGNNNGYLSFLTRTNSVWATERMRITSAGNVGIGTAAPTTNLQVVGTGTQANPSGITVSGVSGTSAGDAKLTLEQTSGSGDFQFLVAGTDSRSDGLTANDTYVTTAQALDLTSKGNGSTRNTAIKLGDSNVLGSYGAITFATAAQSVTPTQRMIIDQVGNVGISTAAPLFRLQVTGADSTYDSGNGQTGTFAVGIGSGLTADGKIEMGFHETGSSSAYGWMQAINTTYSWRNLLLNPAGGNVGIGTASPTSAKLEVVGAIYAETGGAGSYNQSSAAIGTRTTGNGNGVEWGHANGAGYGSVLGDDVGGGQPFICFSCEAGSTNNTYRTRGIVGTIMKSDLSGGMYWGRIATANADNQGMTTTMTLSSGGNLTITGSYSPSDLRLKKDVTEISGALEKLALLRGVTYRWKDPNRPQGVQVGVIAQDVQKAFPQLVLSDPSGTLSVNYAGLTAPLVEAIKELDSRSKQLRADNDNLRAEFEAYKRAHP